MSNAGNSQIYGKNVKIWKMPNLSKNGNNSKFWKHCQKMEKVSNYGNYVKIWKKCQIMGK